LRCYPLANRQVSQQQSERQTCALSRIARTACATHLHTWPAAPDPKAQIVICNYIIATMSTKAVTGAPIKDAIAWAEGESKRIYDKR
jgi:hypothetical protein